MDFQDFHEKKLNFMQQIFTDKKVWTKKVQSSKGFSQP